MTLVRGAAPGTPAELGRFSDRLGFFYVEHARIDRESNAVVFWKDKTTTHVPAAMLGALLTGPGTRITHAAITLLARSGCSIVWVGEEGVRLYAGTIAAVRSSALLVRQARLASAPRSRAQVARAMYAMRFPGEDVSRLPVQKLRGREGARVRACYRRHADRTGVPWTTRSYRPGEWKAADPVNRALSAANAALYGVVHAAALHRSPGLGFIHTGHQLSFVYDIADLYKAEVTIPAAFDVAAESDQQVGSRARRAVRGRIVATDLLPTIVGDVKTLLGAADIDVPAPGDEPMQLWDGERTVPVGVNYEAPS